MATGEQQQFRHAGEESGIQWPLVNSNSLDMLGKRVVYNGHW